MKILWATTFSADLWQESGRLLVESFLATKTPGTLVAYVEGMDVPAASNVLQHRLEGNTVLTRFLEKHRSVIPRAIGGELEAPECRCRTKPLGVHDKKHRLPCPGYWFCKNAYRWLRKPLAANLACEEYGDHYDIMMWVDADARFLKLVPSETVAGWFGGKAGCVYLKNKRFAIETGVFGYHLKRGGRRIAQAVLNRYTSGKFRSDERWDDCVQMARGLAVAKVPSTDLATSVGPNNTVIQFSPMAEYLGHNKGTHRRLKKLT